MEVTGQFVSIACAEWCGNCALPASIFSVTVVYRESDGHWGITPLAKPRDSASEAQAQVISKTVSSEQFVIFGDGGFSNILDNDAAMSGFIADFTMSLDQQLDQQQAANAAIYSLQKVICDGFSIHFVFPDGIST
jgi:hypothetical protein